MATKVITVINFKGGVGKSTVTFNLAYEIKRKGKSVLMIDFDGQGSLSKFTGANKHYENNNIITMLDAVTKNTLIEKDPIIKLENGLDIITCDIRKENWSNTALSEIAREKILKKYIDSIKLRYNYDYILIDNAPSVKLDFQNSLVASDYYLIVTEAEIGSTDGISTISNIISQITEHYNENLKPAGIVMNKVQKQTNLHSIMSELIKESWGGGMYVFDSYIPKSISCGESQYLYKSVYELDRKSKISLAFEKFSDEFLDRIDKLNKE